MAKGALTSIHGRKLGVYDNGDLASFGSPLLTITKHTITPAAGAANVSNVTIQVVDNQGGAVAGVRKVNVWLSDDAAGAVITTVTASGTVTPTTGTVLNTPVTKKYLECLTDATGKIVLAITDTAKTQFYVNVEGMFHAAVNARVLTANYG